MQALMLTIFALCFPFILCYDDKFDKMDVDKIINDDAMFDAYVKCMLDKGECNVKHSAEIRGMLFYYSLKNLI